MSEEICLRAHHGMCLYYFRGAGYSDEFTAHMASVKGRLERGASVRLTSGCDEICAACPNRREDQCLTMEKVRRYDNAVYSVCRLHPGDKLPYSEFAELVRKKLLCAGLRQNICGDCEWSDLCR